MNNMTPNRFGLTVITLISSLLLGCGDDSAKKQEQAGAPLPSVIVSTVKMLSINPSRRFVGRTEAVEDVQIKARVSGYLLTMDFNEGQNINEGDLLFKLDPKPYETEVAKLVADVSRQQAALTNAKRNFRRGNELVEDGFISAMEMDDLTSRRDQAEGSLAESNAALEAAKLDLSYTQMVAPISGRIGRKSLSIGDLVTPDSGVLVTIVTVDPMYVTFDISEKYVANAAREKKLQGAATKTLPVPSIELPNGDIYEHTGTFDFIDNRVDTATGTVKVRAVFPNKDGKLIPGQYVTAIVTANEALEAILVPQSAVSEDQQGHFVMVVGNDNEVQTRRVTMGDRIEVSWVVDEGLKAGERVIVEGLQKVRAGQKVDAVEQTVKAFDETANK